MKLKAIVIVKDKFLILEIQDNLEIVIDTTKLPVAIQRALEDIKKEKKSEEKRR
jgi:hypothetical protein